MGSRCRISILRNLIASIHHESLQFSTTESLKPGKERERNQKRQANHFPTKTFHEATSSVGGPASRQNVVYDEDARAPAPVTRIGVNFEAVIAVLECVRLSFRSAREFPGFSHWDESRSQLLRHGSTKDEATTLDCDDMCDLRLGEALRHCVGDGRK